MNQTGSKMDELTADNQSDESSPPSGLMQHSACKILKKVHYVLLNVGSKTQMKALAWLEQRVHGNSRARRFI